MKFHIFTYGVTVKIRNLSGWGLEIYGETKELREAFITCPSQTIGNKIKLPFRKKQYMYVFNS